MQQRLPGDPSICRACVLLLVVGLGVLAAVWMGLVPMWKAHLVSLAPTERVAELMRAVSWLIGAASLTLLVGAGYMWRVGSKVRRTSTFPTPGTRVCRATIVRTGAAARSLGLAMQGVAVLMLAATVGVLISGVRVIAFFRGYA